MNYIYTLILSVIGLILAYYIWNKKRKKEKLICLIGKDCSKVVESKYAATFGIDNTILGMLYYAVAIVVCLFIILYPSIFVFSLYIRGFLLVAGLSALFSLYLTFVQVFLLKEFCEYCLANTLIVLLIFVFVIL